MGYKLTYFNLRGLGEYMRLLMIDNGIEFEDDRIVDPQVNWPKIKATMPFGQVPCLYDGDDRVVQTGAILRHLARKHNLAGSNESEMAFIDMFCEGVRDMRSKYGKMIYGDYENGKDAFIKNTYPQELSNLENLFKTHLGGTEFVAGGKISYADYVLFEELDVALTLDPHALDNFPLLNAFHSRFMERPNLKAHLEHRVAVKENINGNGKQ